MNGLLKTLVKPDWDDSPKRTEILNAANLLQVGEFQLIQLEHHLLSQPFITSGSLLRGN